MKREVKVKWSLWIGTGRLHHDIMVNCQGTLFVHSASEQIFCNPAQVHSAASCVLVFQMVLFRRKPFFYSSPSWTVFVGNHL